MVFIAQSAWKQLGMVLHIIRSDVKRGKSYAVMDYFVHEWKTKHKQFTWLRLTEASQKKLLNNNAAQFVDADIARRFDLELTVKRKSGI